MPKAAERETKQDGKKKSACVLTPRARGAEACGSRGAENKSFVYVENSKHMTYSYHMVSYEHIFIASSMSVLSFFWRSKVDCGLSVFDGAPLHLALLSILPNQLRLSQKHRRADLVNAVPVSCI
jgi:hypothetical protein